MKYFRIFILFLLFIEGGGGILSAGPPLRIEHLPQTIQQGDVCLIKASGPASLKSIYGEFRKERLPMAVQGPHGTYVGLLGMDMNIEPARYKLTVMATDENRGIHKSILTLKVEKTDFRTQTLSLPPHMVDLDAQTMERVEKEEKRLKVLFSGYRKEKLWKGPFARPVPGELSTKFGLRRIINGQPKSPHTGVDLRAEEGTPVLASNDGIVVLVDQLFFPGKSVILDHGWGTYSMYFHLSEILVRKGDRISKENVLGRVGSTGRSKGPHLHWGVRMNGARVDPVALLRLGEGLRE
jgi:murein DD-endopeptidase MepM/ murein hydrolase activator NlpD